MKYRVPTNKGKYITIEAKDKDEAVKKFGKQYGIFSLEIKTLNAYQHNLVYATKCYQPYFLIQRAI